MCCTVEMGESPYLHIAAGDIRLAVVRSLGSHGKGEPEEQATLCSNSLTESGVRHCTVKRGLRLGRYNLDKG